MPTYISITFMNGRARDTVSWKIGPLEKRHGRKMTSGLQT